MLLSEVDSIILRKFRTLSTLSRNNALLVIYEIRIRGAGMGGRRGGRRRGQSRRLIKCKYWEDESPPTQREHNFVCVSIVLWLLTAYGVPLDLMPSNRIDDLPGSVASARIVEVAGSIPVTDFFTILQFLNRLRWGQFTYLLLRS